MLNRSQRVLMALTVSLCLAPPLHAQASALPSAASEPTDIGARGHKLVDQMIAALGGDAYLNRGFQVINGQIGNFYKGQSTGYSYGFQEFSRIKPFAERVIFISHSAPLAILGLPGKDKHDVATVWTEKTGWQITYEGKKELPEKDVTEFERRRAHSLDVVLHDWLHQPGVIVSYEGTDMVDRHLADKVSIITATNDAVTLELDEGTHLPLSLSFRYRDPQFKDFDTDTEEYDDYHAVQGIQTPYTITRLHNGDMTIQRFITKVTYEQHLDDNLFDPDRPLDKKAKY